MRKRINRSGRRITFRGTKGRRIEVRADGNLRGHIEDLPGGWTPDKALRQDLANRIGADAIISVAMARLPAVVVDELLAAEAEVEAEWAEREARFLAWAAS